MRNRERCQLTLILASAKDSSIPPISRPADGGGT
jgi:hypothetical protein